MTFNELRLIEPIVRAVADEGYSTPTPIQAQSIPDALAGRDILGCAQTGTGKTCAFALPILQRLAGPKTPPGQQPRRLPRGRAPRALVLCPTRELATQIFESFVVYGRQLPLRHTCVFGGVNQFRQVKALGAGVDVLVATPGRLLDLQEQGHVDLTSIETLVLDEADRMLDMGFIHDIRKIVALTPKERQTLFFSATLSPEIRRLSDSMLRDPVRVETAPEATTVESIAQRVYHVERGDKPMLLTSVLSMNEVRRTLVFTKTKHGADKLTKLLNRAGINADTIHGNKSQNARNRAMQGFRSGATTVLVATDVASRGIDVDDISHVVNYDMPVDPETYVHRIGRTARAGASGVAMSFCDRDEIGILRAIERRTRIEIEVGNEFPELALAINSRPHRPDGGAPRPHRKGPKPNRALDAAEHGDNRDGFPGKKKFKPRGRKPTRNGGGGGRPASGGAPSRSRNAGAGGRGRKAKTNRAGR
ncbi:MAG: DEAD/DEAH box helicase [Phycisphaeraceae bacterium]|nr:DEAD/DEAH box helicase [Phycisphaeraceae bacterium]